MSDASGPADAAHEAIATGIAAFATLGIDPDAYQLVAVRSDALSRDANPFRWLLEFKTTSSMPTKPGGKVGKGGELALSVDLQSGEVTRRRGGD